MFNDLKKIMKDNYNINDLNLTSNFKKDFGLTSFDFVNLVCLIEDKYKIEIDAKYYRSLNTIEDLIKYLELLV